MQEDVPAPASEGPDSLSIVDACDGPKRGRFTGQVISGVGVAVSPPLAAGGEIGNAAS